MEVCYHHGGATPKGLASPHYKTGRHSRYLPAKLLESYRLAESDDTLLELRQDIQLLDALIAAKLPLLETGESAETWEYVSKNIRQARKAYKSEHYGELEDALDQLEALADKRRLYYATEQEVTAQLEQRRKMVESERKRLIDMQQMITNEQALLLVGALVGIIKTRVTDRNVLSAIQNDITGLLARRTGDTIDAAAVDYEQGAVPP